MDIPRKSLGKSTACAGAEEGIRLVEAALIVVRAEASKVRRSMSRLDMSDVYDVERRGQLHSFMHANAWWAVVGLVGQAAPSSTLL